MNNINKTKETAINIRTSEEIKKQFNEMVLGGATQTEKFEYLMSLYNESLGRQAKLDITEIKKAIEISMEKITTSLKEVEVQANEWQNRIVDCYVNGLGEEFNILKGEIEFDEEAKAKVEDLEKQTEKLQEKLIEERDRLAQASDKIKELEEENKNLVKSEAAAIKDLAQAQAQAIKDSTELISLKAKYEEKMEQLESANKELTELRKYKYAHDELEAKYNKLLEEANKKESKSSSKSNKKDETK